MAKCCKSFFRLWRFFTSLLHRFRLACNFSIQKNIAKMQGKEKKLGAIFSFKLPSCIPLRMRLVHFKVLDIPAHQGLVAFQDQQVFGNIPPHSNHVIWDGRWPQIHPYILACFEPCALLGRHCRGNGRHSAFTTTFCSAAALIACTT